MSRREGMEWRGVVDAEPGAGPVRKYGNGHRPRAAALPAMTTAQIHARWPSTARRPPMSDDIFDAVTHDTAHETRRWREGRLSRSVLGAPLFDRLAAVDRTLGLSPIPTKGPDRHGQ